MQFVVEFRTPLPDGQLLATRNLDTARTTLRVGDAIGGGFAGGSFGYRDYGGGARGMRLQDPLDLVHLADVTVWVDAAERALVYQGRVQKFDQPGGGRVSAFTTTGYGSDAAKDKPFSGGGANEAPISGGQLIRRAQQLCAPLLRIGDAHQFVDPGGLYKPAEQNGRYFGSIIDQVVKAGSEDGTLLVYTVYEDRVVSLLPRTPPKDEDGFYTWDYQVMPDEDSFTWSEDGAALISGAAVEFQPLGGSGQITEVVSDPDAPILQYGLERILQVPNATMEQGQAELVARTMVKRFGRPVVTAVTVCDARHVLRDRGGAPVPAWQPRSGQWLHVEGYPEPLLITACDKDLSAGENGKVTIQASNTGGS